MSNATAPVSARIYENLTHLGFYVVPAKSKTALPAGWPGLATNDPAKSAELFAKYPGYPYASIYTGAFGAGEALLVVDIDPWTVVAPEGMSKADPDQVVAAIGDRLRTTYGLPATAGKKELARAIAANETKRLFKEFNLPRTRAHGTPSGGVHLIFRTPHALTQGSAIKSLGGKGFDTRSDGGQIHFGKGYTHFPDSPKMPAPAPDALIRACGERAHGGPSRRRDPNAGPVVPLDKAAVTARAIEYLKSLPVAQEGERNQCLYRTAAKLRGMGVEHRECRALCREHFRCAPPMDETELDRTIRSVYEGARTEQVGGETAQADFSKVSGYFNDAGTWTAQRIREEIESGSFAEHARIEPDRAAEAVDMWDLLDIGPGVIEAARGALVQANAEGKAEIEAIFWEPSKLPEIVDRVTRAVLKAGDVFARGERYVRLVQFPPRTKEQMRISRGGVEIEEFTQVSLRERIMRAVRFREWQGKSKASTQVDIICPDTVADTLHHRRGAGAPGLTGLVSAPTITHTGRLLTAPGYNAESGLYATFEANDFPPINANPSRRDAQAALRFLADDVLADYPFDQEVDRYVAVAALLTGIVRSALDLAPAFLMEAASVQAGKTSLCQFIIGIPTTGTAVIPQSWTDAEERRKAVHTALREGQRVLLFDNIPKGTIIDDPTLAMILTSPTARGRILGRSQSASYETDILVLLTGNNVQLKGDMDSRVLACRLSPPVNRPEPTRSQLDQWMIEHRAQVVTAALTVVRAYVAAGYPAVEHFSGRFWQWGRFVQQPIIWAGGHDPAVKFIAAIEDDPEMEANAQFFGAWRAVFEDRGVSATDIKKTVQTADMAEAAQQAFADTVWGMVTQGPTRRIADLNVQRIGQKLKELRDVRAGGYRLTGKRDEHLNAWRYYVVKE